MLVEALLEDEVLLSVLEERLELLLSTLEPVLELLLSTEPELLAGAGVETLEDSLVVLEELLLETFPASLEPLSVLEEFIDDPDGTLDDSLCTLEPLREGSEVEVLTLPFSLVLGVDTLELSVLRILLVLPDSALRGSVTLLEVAVLFTLALFQCDV